MMPVQFDLFQTEEEAELSCIRKSIEAVKVSSDKVRRGTYARLNEISKDCIELKLRLEIIEQYICKG